MPGGIGNHAGAAAGGAIGGTGDRADDGTKAKAFEKALSQFARQIVETDMDEMNRAMQETEEDFQ